jgi:predicted tellurium resistance membrane protein TerC
VADAAMSLDNVLGVAAAARDDLGLLVLGLALSMGMMLLAGNAIAQILGRFPWLVFAGSAVIAWTGAAMALRDPALLAAPALSAALPWLGLAVPAPATGAALLLGYRRRRRPSGTVPPGSPATAGEPPHRILTTRPGPLTPFRQSPP